MLKLKNNGVIRNTNFLKLWAGQAISVFGDMITFLAIPIIVYQMTGSKSALSATVCFRVLPIILLGPFAGALVDRWDRKKIMILSDVLRAMLTVPLLLVPKEYLVVTIYIVVALKSMIGIFFGPSLNSVIPNLVKKEELLQVNSITGMTSNTLQFVTPLIGSALVAKFGARPVLLIDFISFMVSALSIYLVTVPHKLEALERTVNLKSLGSDIAQGFRFIIKSPMLVIIMITTVITQFGQGFIQPLWLPYVVEVLKEPKEKFMLLVSMQGLGSILGSIIIMLLGVRKAKSVKLSYIIFTLGVGIAIFMQITTIKFNIFIMWGTLVGVFFSGYMVATQTIIQHTASDQFMGRVNSTFMMLNQGFMLIAVSISAVFADYLTTRVLFILACSFWLAGCILGAALMLTARESGVPAKKDVNIEDMV